MAAFRRATPVLLLFALLALPAAAGAEERILRFGSDIQVEQDGALDVRETIDVRAEHDRINHGIFRDFPTHYRGIHGGKVRIGFTFEGATLDGRPVAASVQPFANGVRVKLGDPDSYVDVGEHRYAIRYRATREIGRFSDYDELYWNVTGNGWDFPIDVAEARIKLPRQAEFGQRAVYTGPQGSTVSNAEVADEKPGEIAFRTTRPLGPYEGLTIAVAFPKGVVGQPGAGSRAWWWLQDYGPPAVGVLGLIGLLAFYFIAWKRAGRNPRAGTIVPLFSPPDGLSPAGMRYVWDMSADNRAFAAALVDLGVKGHVRLEEEDGGFFSGKKLRLERLESVTPLPDDESEALRALCPAGESIVLEQKNHAIFSSAKNNMSDILTKEYEGRLFRRNYGWAAAGLFLFAAVMWVTAAAVDVSLDGAYTWQVGLVIGLLTLTALLWLAFHESAVGKCLLSLLGFVALSTGAVIGMTVFTDALNSGWWQPLAVPALAIPLVISAFWWIAAPTAAGRQVLDHIAGFKHYLSITERERLDRMTAPQDTSELFEKYLPYAIALGVENRWADRFEGVLAAASAAGRQGFHWYAGSSNPWENPGRFAESVGSSLTSTISSASSAPGSSSGSGGGGSSGGGGGGGGGGGW